MQKQIAFLFLLIILSQGCRFPVEVEEKDITPLSEAYPKPDRTNTGPRTTDLEIWEPGLTKIKEDGAVLEGFSLEGEIWIEADNVVLRDFVIHGDGIYDPIEETGNFYGIKMSGGTNATFEYGEIRRVLSAGILGSGFTARHLYIHDTGGDGIKVSDGNRTLIEACFIEKLGMRDGAHADAVQMRSGGSDAIFRYNHFSIPGEASSHYPGSPYKANTTFMMTDTERYTDILVEYNWLYGGGFTVYGVPGMSLRGNRFGDEAYYHYGVLTGEVDLWEENVWDETGEIIDF